MGLDHGLRKRHYVKNWDHMKEGKYQITVLRDGKPDPNFQADRIEYIEEEVVTWRKSNQIHRWFVENVQDGNDDCHSYYVSRDQIWELLRICQKVVNDSKLVQGKVSNGYRFDDKGEKVYDYVDGRIIDNPKVAKALLPTQEGFFFGSQDYDQWYLEDLEETAAVLKTELAIGTATDHYEYWSSW